MIGRWRKKDEETVVVSVPVDVIHRQMLYDGLQDVRALGELAGLAPVSDEVDEMERRESEKRLEDIAYLFPCLMNQTEWMATLAVAVQLKELEEAGASITEQELEQLTHAVLALVRSSVVSSVSTIVGLGLLEIPEVVREQHQ